MNKPEFTIEELFLIRTFIQSYKKIEDIHFMDCKDTEYKEYIQRRLIEMQDLIDKINKPFLR